MRSNKVFKKALSLILCVALVFGAAPLAGLVGLNITTTEAEAATDGYYSYEVSNGKATITSVDTSISGSITIPSALGGYPVTSIGYRAFYYCTNLESITIPDSVTSIGKQAFSGCKSLESVTFGENSQLTSIGKYAFYNCTSLESVIISDSVTSIDDEAFYDCTSLESITVDSNNKNYSSDEYGVLFNKDKTELIKYPAGNTRTSYTIPDSVTSIGEDAFRGCTSLASITIPDSVTSIGDLAFHYCKSLESITFGENSKLTSIGYDAFNTCISLYEINIPENVETIDGGAFSGCLNLKTITGGGSISSVGSGAFENTGYYLTEENWENGILYIAGALIRANNDVISEAVDIKQGTTCIGDDAFSYCTSLESVTIPDGVTSIGDFAFYYCQNLESITIPDSVTSIGDNAFYDCTSLESITIPDSVTSIGNWAFFGCTNLKSITIPDSVTSIGRYAFYNTAYYNNESNWENGILYIAGALIRANNDVISEAVVIKQGTTCISDDAFYWCTSLESVTIPDSVTSIGKYAFEDCTSLASVTFGENSQLTSIGWCAFSGCTNLSSITIPDSVTRIGRWAFFGCTNLASITIPDSVTSISGWAFYNTAYYNNESNWENGVLYIGKHLIEAKKTVSGSYTIKDGTKTIADYAFYWCTSLESVTIPDSVTSIGEYAFYNCTSLEDVYYSGTESEWNAIIIGDENGYLVFATIHFGHKKPTTDPTEPTTDPTEPTTDPTEPTTDPTEPTTRPTEPTTKPTEPTTKPTEPSTKPSEPAFKLEIRKPSTTTINYGDSIILHADIEGTLPDDSEIVWTANNGNFDMSVSSDGTTCEITPSSSGDTTFTATVYDKDGNVVSSDTQKMTSKAGLWQKIVAFFKKLFSLNKVITEVFKGILK